MIIFNHRKSSKRVFLLMLLILFFCGTVNVFSQEILASFGIGLHFLNREKNDHELVEGKYYGGGAFFGDETIVNGFTTGVNILFIGSTGFTISSGIDMIWDFTNRINIDPVFGLGYVNYNKFYIGGILNFEPKSYMTYFVDKKDGYVRSGDVFITPTFVAGYDFGNFLLGGQLSYMVGGKSNISGFKLSSVVGVNVGK